MNYYGHDNLGGGRTHYGSVAGILSLYSTCPRLPGDPGHAQTFNFPVTHAVVDDVTIKDLIELDPTNLSRMIEVAQQLEAKGVRFIATSCGLFAPFQYEIAEHLSVPFLSSSLQIVALLRGFTPAGKKIAVITGHAGLLSEEHLRNSGFSLDDVVIKGMEDYPEFNRVVIEGGSNLDPEKFNQDVIDAALSLKNGGESIAMVVLECPNIITFKNEIQKVLNVAVFDIVSMINFFASGYQLTRSSPSYL